MTDKDKWIENLFLDPLIAKLAKEKKFDEPCLATWEFYTLKDETFIQFNLISTLDHPIYLFKPEIVEIYKNRPGLFGNPRQPAINSQLHPWLYAAPTFEQLQLWFYEKHKFSIPVWPNHEGYRYSVIRHREKENLVTAPGFELEYTTARDKCIIEAFKLIK